jgi:hypothetical protein
MANICRLPDHPSACRRLVTSLILCILCDQALAARVSLDRVEEFLHDVRAEITDMSLP